MLSRYSFSKYFTRSNIIQFLVLSLLSQILILIITFVITSKLEAIGFSFLLLPFYFPSIILLILVKLNMFDKWYAKLSFLYPILMVDCLFMGNFIYDIYHPSNDGSSQILVLVSSILNLPIPFLYLIHKYVLK